MSAYPSCCLLMNVFVTSRLDYCLAFYLGVTSTKRLQLVQKAAARLLTEHITPLCYFSRSGSDLKWSCKSNSLMHIYIKKKINLAIN